MNNFSEQVQHAYDRGGKAMARQTFLDVCVEKDWSREEIVEAIALYRSLTGQ